MLLARLQRPAVACALLAAAVAAGCGGDGGPGPGPNPTTISVTAVSPSTGTTFGGTTITITGTGFKAGATVQVGGSAATDVVVVSPTSITAKTPAHAAGAGEVRVSVGAITGALASGFTFVTPAVGPNTPPTVSAITVQAPRPGQPPTLASIGDRMSMVASINDAETALSALTIEWSALPNIGSFSGTGASVQWVAPSSTTSPQTVVLMLTVVEKYQEPDSSGLPVQREHRVQRTTTLKVHDTVKEVTDMAVDFLTLFSNSSLSPEVVLHNFSKTCDGGNGYGDEYNDVVKSRNERVILSYAITPPTVFEYEFGASNACSRRNQTPGDVCVEVPITWTDRAIGSTTVETVSGIDFVTGVYENAQWRLCHSRWTGSSTTTGAPRFMDFTFRGRPIIRGPGGQ